MMATDGSANSIAFTPLIVSYTVEILPFQLRAKGFTVFNFAISLSLIFNQYVNPVALGKIAWKYYVSGLDHLEGSSSENAMPRLFIAAGSPLRWFSVTCSLWRQRTEHWRKPQHYSMEKMLRTTLSVPLLRMQASLLYPKSTRMDLLRKCDSKGFSAPCDVYDVQCCQ
jgi:hypothetical protein